MFCTKKNFKVAITQLLLVGKPEMQLCARDSENDNPLCFRYQPVPSIYRMPPRPTLPLVVKKNEDNKLTGSQTPETAIEMSNV